MEKPGTELIANLADIELDINYLVRRTFVIPTSLLPQFKLGSVIRKMRKAKIEPVIVADMDDTLTPFRREISDEMIEMIFQLLQQGIKFVILTSSSMKAVKDQVLKKLFAQKKGKERAFSNLYIFPAQGSQAYHFDTSKKNLN